MVCDALQSHLVGDVAAMLGYHGALASGRRNQLTSLMAAPGDAVGPPETVIWQPAYAPTERGVVGVDTLSIGHYPLASRCRGSSFLSAVDDDEHASLSSQPTARVPQRRSASEFSQAGSMHALRCNGRSARRSGFRGHALSRVGTAFQAAQFPPPPPPPGAPAPPGQPMSTPPGPPGSAQPVTPQGGAPPSHQYGMPPAAVGPPPPGAHLTAPDGSPLPKGGATGVPKRQEVPETDDRGQDASADRHSGDRTGNTPALTVALLSPLIFGIGGVVVYFLFVKDPPPQTNLGGDAASEIIDSDMKSMES